MEHQAKSFPDRTIYISQRSWLVKKDANTYCWRVDCVPRPSSTSANSTLDDSL